jgi:putative ABC transport system ATP-binding protein
MQNAIDIKHLIFSWPGSSTPALQIESFTLARAERVFLRGQSGSGKSTLLNLVAGVLDGHQGELKVLGEELSELRPSQRDKLRAEHIGYIFQQFNLLPYLNVLDNTTLACRLSASRRQRACAASGSVEEAAFTLMDELGLARSLAKQPVTNLSIGQQQRVAAARALIGGPDLIIADEPTSALDTEHRQRFIEQLLATCAERDVALLFVSHDPGLQQYFDRIVDMRELNQGAVHVLD